MEVQNGSEAGQKQQTIEMPQIPSASQMNPQGQGVDGSKLLSGPSNPQVIISGPAVQEKSIFLLGTCERCFIVARIPGFDMSFRRVAERKCPQCGSDLLLPQELMEMFILYGHFIPEAIGASIALGTTVLQPEYRADFVASAMNELLVPLHTDYVYDIAVPKRKDGLGMSLRMNSELDVLSSSQTSY